MNTNVKVTKKDNFSTLINVLTTVANYGYDVGEGVDIDALVDFCDNEIALLEKRSAKAKESAAAKKAEADVLTEAIAAALPSEFISIDSMVALMDDAEITRGKVQYRLNQLVKTGVAEKGELTVNIDGKNKKIAAYRAVV